MSLARDRIVCTFAAALSLAGCSGRSGTQGTGDMARAPVNLDGFIDPGMVTPTDFAAADLPPTYETIWAHTGTTLYTVDPSTFALTTIGDFNGPEDMTDLAVTPDGKVYTVSRTGVYSVDQNTGEATTLATGISSSNVALTFRLDGKLLAADQAGNVIIIDTTNGSTTTLGKYSSNMSYDTAGDLVAVADGTMYGVSTKAPNISDKSNVLIKVNTSTAKATTVGSIGFTGVFGTAYSGGRVLAFTKTGQIIQIDPSTGAGTLVATHTGTAFYGAGTSPLVPIL
ncbi:MAG: hypothetical protein ABI321_10705 [Polyangia bacterium]